LGIFSLLSCQFYEHRKIMYILLLFGGIFSFTLLFSYLFFTMRFFFPLFLWWGDTLWHLHGFLQCIKYILNEYISSTILLHSLSPNSWSSFNKYHFCIYIHVHTFFCTVFTLLSPLFPTPLSSHSCQLPPPPFPGRTWFSFLYSDFVEEKRRKDTTKSMTN
jgi:hypothetical protein